MKLTKLKKAKHLQINNKWYKKDSVRPKVFNVVMKRTSKGEYEIVSGHVAVEVNQYEAGLQRVDCRDLGRDIRKSKIIVK